LGIDHEWIAKSRMVCPTVRDESSRYERPRKQVFKVSFLTSGFPRINFAGKNGVGIVPLSSCLGDFALKLPVQTDFFLQYFFRRFFLTDVPIPQIREAVA